MKDGIRNLKGSPREDQWILDRKKIIEDQQRKAQWRFGHKEIAGIYSEAEQWHATNGDLFLIQGYIPIALLCLKESPLEFDSLTNCEKNLCDWCRRKGLPVFVFRGTSIWNGNVYDYEIGGQENFVSGNYISWEREFRKRMTQ